MNEKTPPRIFQHRRIVLILILASLLLALAFAAPALAAAFPPRSEQGTVPPPPPIGGDEDDDDDDDDDDDEVFPTATPTPGAVAEAPVAEAPAAEAPVAEAPAAQSALIAPQNGAANFAGTVLSPRLNVRMGPAVTFGSLGQYLQNDPVTIQFRDNSGQWWYTCCVAGTTTGGWSSASFIQPDFDPAQAVNLLPIYPGLEQVATPVPATPLPAATPTSRPVASGALTALVDAQPRLIVREGPSTNDAIVGRVNDGVTVEVIARNAAGDWWYICCVDGGDAQGWANASFLVADFNTADALRLIPLFGADSLLLPTPTPRALIILPKQIKLNTATPTATPLTVAVPTAASTPTPTASPPTPTAVPPTPTTAAPEPTSTLLPEEEAPPGALIPAEDPAALTSLTAIAWQEPAFAAPGETVLLRWLISNSGADVARDVELRNELPAELALQTGAGSRNAQFSSAQGTAGSVFALQWPEIPAGESVTATVAVTLAPTLAHGSVIRNLAAIGAQNAAALTAGITISTPPTSLPTFK